MTDMDTRLPRLLKKGPGMTGLTEAGRLRPSCLSVMLCMDPLSVADMTLSRDDPEVRMHDFVELYGQNGSLGIYRAANITLSSDGERKIRLNHALDVFADAILPGEEDRTGTVAQILSQIMACQAAGPDNTVWWQLGTVQDTGMYTLANHYGSALEAIKRIAWDEDQYCFSFDFGTFPWTLHFLCRDNAVCSEFRLDRNTDKCTVTLDDSDLCTKLYLSIDTVISDADGSTTVTTHETHEDADARAIWGTVVRTAGIEAARVPDKAAWIRQYFARHAQPAVQITLSGQELNRLTGEPMDRIYPGRICRVAMPEYGAVFEQRIMVLQYPDILRQPERVNVQLANKKPSSEGIFSGLRRSMRNASTVISKNTREIERNKYSLRAADRHITDIGVILHAAGLEIDPHGVWLYAGEDGPDYALGASFRVQAEAISAEVTRATAAEGTMGSRITQTADAITAEVMDRQSADNSLSSRITQNASSISLVVSDGGIRAASIVTAINNAGSSVVISADKVDINGYLTAHTVQVDGLSSTKNIMSQGWVVAGSYVNAGTDVQINGTSLKSAIVSFGTATASGGSVTIPTTTFGGTAGPSINFNIADTKFYKDGVAAVTLKAQNPYTWTNGVYLSNLGAVSATVTAHLTNNKTPSGAVLIPVSGIPTDTYTQVSWARKGLNSYGYAQMYVYERNTYYSAGTHYWYWSGSGGWDTLYERN